MISCNVYFLLNISQSLSIMCMKGFYWFEEMSLVEYRIHKSKYKIYIDIICTVFKKKKYGQMKNWQETCQISTG